MKKNSLTYILLSTIFFIPSLLNFFSGDDWFHLRVSQIGSFKEFLNFFSLVRTSQSIAFYRPLPTQGFFFIFQRLFGLNPPPYHLFVLFCFGYSLYLLHHFVKLLTANKQVAIIAVLIYGFSVSNFTRLYFLSAFQEIALVIFSLLTLTSYLENKRKKSLVFFLLALLSKETAIVLPFLIIITAWLNKKIKIPNFLPYFALLVPYLYLRFRVFGATAGDTYLWNFSPVKALNTLTWYILWAIGSPELLVDYIGSGFKPIPRFFTDFHLWWPWIILPLVILILLSVYLLFKNYVKERRNITYGVLFFMLSISPVLFLPTHKFSLELGLPLVGFSLVMALLLPKSKLANLFLVVFIFYNLAMNYLTYTTHYSVNRGKISQKTYEYFVRNYPKEPTNSYLEFINDTPSYTKEWGSSRQVSNAIGGSELFRVLYHDPGYTVYFEDFPFARPQMQVIKISSKIFLE